MGVRVGAAVLDRPTREVGRVAHVEYVPRRLDLFGQPLKAHRRYVVVFRDGRWCNDRRRDDLAPIDERLAP